MNNYECKDEEKLNQIIEDDNFNKKDNIKQTPCIDINSDQSTKDFKVEHEINIYENNTQNNLLPLKEFDAILNNYQKENLIENNSYDLNINELIFDLDELDLVINDMNNINNAYEEPEHIEHGVKNEFIKLDKLNYILKEFNMQNTSVTENKLLIPSLTLTDNIKDLNSLREFRITNTKLIPINKTEIVYDFEKDIKINEIFILKNNIESTEGSDIKTVENDGLNSVQDVSEALNEGNLNKTEPFVDEIDIISISSDEDNKSIIEILSESNDSDCSDYHSSDFEFIDEEEAKRTGLINNTDKEITVKIETQNSQDLIIHDYFHLPVGSTDKENHVVPEGVDYINLFGGNYTPLPTTTVQNKAISAGTSMNAGVDGIGFDLRMLQENPELEAYKDEAHESEQKILKLYPIENRRKRSRRY